MSTFSPRNRRLLSGVLSSERVSGAYAFYGVAGSQLQAAAAFFGMGILCEFLQDGEPCLTCHSCATIGSGQSIHYRMLSPEKWGIDQVRDIQELVQYGAVGDRMVVVISQADRFTTEAANAFLKTLEEPPFGVTFILLTYQVMSLLPTIKSRCQLLDFPVMPVSVPGQDNPELARYEAEFGQGLSIPYRPLAEVLGLSLDERMKYAQEIATSKPEVLVMLTAWLRDSLALDPVLGAQIWQKLIATVSDMKYNVNLRLHVEKLLICMS